MSKPPPKQAVPEASAPGREGFAASVFLLICAFLLFLRRPDAIVSPQLWAEDGVIFLRQSFETGLESLSTPFSGYHHLIPRLLAYAALLLPLVHAPAVYAWLSMGCCLWVAWELLSGRIPLRHKPALALAPFLTPHSGEVFLNLANLQWLTALLLLAVLLKQEARNRGETLHDAFLVLLCGFTGLFSILFLPLFLLRAVYLRSKHSLLLLGLLSIPAAIQALGLDDQNKPVSEAVIAAADKFSILGYRLFGMLFLASFRPGWEPGATVVAYGGLTLYFAYLAVRPMHRPNRLHRILLLGAAVILIGSVSVKFWGAAEMLASPSAGDRYFFLPRVMLFWLLIDSLDDSPAIRLANICLLTLAAASLAVFFRAEPMRDMHWPHYARQLEKGRAVTVPLNPPGFFTDIRPAER